jgi:hypothetical protein
MPERAFFAFGEFLALVLGIAAAFAWTWAMGALVAFACMGVLHVLWRAGAIER